MDLTPNFKKPEKKSADVSAENSINEKNLDDFFESELKSDEDIFSPTSEENINGAVNGNGHDDLKPEENLTSDNGIHPFKVEEPSVFESTKPPKEVIPFKDLSTEKKPESQKPLPSLPPISIPLPIEKTPPLMKDPLPSIPTPPLNVTAHVNEVARPTPASVPKPKNESSPALSTATHQIGDFVNGLLKFMVEKRASDLHLRAGTPIIFRVDGNLLAFDKSIVSSDMARDLLFHMLPQRQKKIFEVKNEADFSYAVPSVGRFRGNAFRQRGSVAIVLRQIPTIIPTFSELNLPSVMEKFCKLSRGLVLVCGPTGSGKSTALAAMIQQINTERADHIVTIEDPIEFLHRDNKSIVSQRELGTDTISFSEALKHVLRQDPDVILLGEMRDLETTSTAITAAQTGHLVLSTLHTTDAVQTINRIVDIYPPHQQQQVRYQLADVLKGVVCQRLIPHARGVGRIPTCEVLSVTPLVKKAIADNKMVDVQEAIRQGQYYGMQTFHQSLLKLYKEGQVKLDDALDAASNPEELMMAIRGITQGAEGT